MPKKTTTYLTTTTLWHNARKELPTESGYYIVIIAYDGMDRCGRVDTLHFSKKHNLFNEYDSSEKPSAYLHQKVFAWARCDDLFGEVYDFMHKEDESDARSLHSRSA